MSEEKMYELKQDYMKEVKDREHDAD